MKKLIKKILDKKFESVINGYSPTIVDSFLDTIIEELESIDKQINLLSMENEKLKEENKILEEKLLTYQISENDKQKNFDHDIVEEQNKENEIE